MQFGHNDGGKPDEPTRARATLPGNGEEVQEIENPLRKVHETVHTYGWYIRSYISQIKAKGGIPVVCSLIPRNRWTDGKVNRADKEYGLWAKQAAEQGAAAFIDLNGIIADKYDAEGQEKVKEYFFTDNLHTVEAGARMNALCVVDGIKADKKLKLKELLK
jgi:lysophospholipase L1-like esterase